MEADEEEDKKGKEKENKVPLSPPPTFPTFKRRDIKGGSRHHSTPQKKKKKKSLFDFLLWDLLSLLKCLIGSINF